MMSKNKWEVKKEEITLRPVGLGTSKCVCGELDREL